MFNRLIRFPKTSSFFLFGPRGSGKTHLLKDRLRAPAVCYIDLLDPETHQTLSLRPKTLIERLQAQKAGVQWVVIDEIQKIPSLLDIVHQQIESTNLRFALTGSSARKLRHGGANLLAGRAFVYHLFPLTASELGGAFSLAEVLRWGALPRVFALKDEDEKRDFLRSYAHVYLQEEITQEQVVRKLEPFRRFIYAAAQMNGQIVNFSKIAREAGSTVATVQSYFQILEDTMMGFLLEPFHESVRKRQRENPKFYFFDTGIKRALSQALNIDLAPGTYEFGSAFESFLINEIHRLQSYGKKDYRLSYLRTKDGVEIDLIVERPGLKRALVEIKSSQRVGPDEVRSLNRLAPDIPNAEAFCLSLDPVPKKIEGVTCLPWQQGLVALGL